MTFGFLKYIVHLFLLLYKARKLSVLKDLQLSDRVFCAFYLVQAGYSRREITLFLLSAHRHLRAKEEVSDTFAS